MVQIINNILNKLFVSIEDETFNLLEKIANISDDIFKIPPLKFIFEEETGQVISILSISLISIFILILLFKNMFSNNNNLIIGFKIWVKIIIIEIICLNSYTICKGIIDVNYNITEEIGGVFENIVGEKIEYSSLKENITTLEEYLKLQDKVGFNGIKEGILVIMLVFLITVFSIRYVMIILCIILSPIFIILSINNRTQSLFILWLKYFIFGLFVQNINKVLLFICISAKDEKEIYASILLGTVILLYKINKKVGEI